MALLFVLAAAQTDKPKIEKGEAAPAIELMNQNDKAVALADYKGKKNVLLAFYPKDATPG